MRPECRSPWPWLRRTVTPWLARSPHADALAEAEAPAAGVADASPDLALWSFALLTAATVK